MVDDLVTQAAEQHAAYVRQYGNVSASHIETCKRLIADASIGLDYRKMIWSTTAKAFAEMGKPF